MNKYELTLTRLTKSALSLLLVTSSATALATQMPIPYETDARIKKVRFQENNVVPLQGRAFTVTQLVFSPDEEVLSVESGDNNCWHATYHENTPNMLFLKPTNLGSNTNISVITNKHTYYFHATSNEALNDNTPVTYAIKFSYPEPKVLKTVSHPTINGAKPKTIAKSHDLKKSEIGKGKIKTPIKVKAKAKNNWNYSFNGNKEIMPLHVYDDGVFTYLELKPNQPVPAVFAVDDKSGRESVVNTRRRGKYIVIQQTAPQFTLRNGPAKVTSIFNNNEIYKIKRGLR